MPIVWKQWLPSTHVCSASIQTDKEPKVLWDSISLAPLGISQLWAGLPIIMSVGGHTCSTKRVCASRSWVASWMKQPTYSPATTRILVEVNKDPHIWGSERLAAFHAPNSSSWRPNCSMASFHVRNRPSFQTSFIEQRPALWSWEARSLENPGPIWPEKSDH